MSPNPRQSPSGKALNIHRAFCELVLEASEADIDELICSLGEYPDELADEALQTWSLALSDNTKNVIVPPSQGTTDLDDPVATEVQRGFSSLMTFLRRGREVEVPELAHSAQVDPEEVVRIEGEPGYIPSPRTIVQLERFFTLPRGTLSRLSGAVSVTSEPIRKDLLKFAACSGGMGKLSNEERKLLNEFVKHLAK